MATNSDHFALDDWKLTLPVDRGGGTSGTAIEISDVDGYEHPQYFFDAPDGAMVFRAAANGATTTGTTYARSELREMDGSRLAGWTPEEGGTMTATLKVDSVPTLSNGQPGRVSVGQIHGVEDELVRLYWDNGKVYFINDHAGSKGKETKFTFRNAEGKEPGVALGETFSYKIDADGDTLTVEIYADGDVYTSVSKINDVWQEDSLYFKAGIYLGVNETQGKGVGQVSFYGLDFGHEAGEGLAGLTAGGSVKVPAQAGAGASPAVGESLVDGEGSGTLTGGRGGYTLRGNGGNDTLAGSEGADRIWGNAGSDLLDGGAGDDWLKGREGSDTYVFAQGHGRDSVHELRSTDTLMFSRDVFASETAFEAALKQTSDGVELWTGTDSKILFTGSSMDDIKNARIELTGSASALSSDAFKIVAGSTGKDTLKGSLAADEIRGDTGHDQLWGLDGSDTLVGGGGDDWLKGGRGEDSFVFGSAHGDDIVFELRGNDTVVFDKSLYASKAAVLPALTQSTDGIELATGADSSILFTGSTLEDLGSAVWLFQDFG